MLTKKPHCLNHYSDGFYLTPVHWAIYFRMFDKSKLIILIAGLLFLSLVDCSYFYKPGRSTSTDGFHLPRLNFSGSEVDEYKSLNEEVTVIFDSPIGMAEYDSETSNEEITPVNLNYDVSVKKIKAGLWVIIALLSYKFVSFAPINTGLTISADLIISMALIYFLQFYFGYVFRVNPFRIEKIPYNPEEMVPRFLTWAVLIPFTWISLIRFLCLPVNTMIAYQPYYGIMFALQIIAILCSLYKDRSKFLNVDRENSASTVSV